MRKRMISLLLCFSVLLGTAVSDRGAVFAQETPKEPSKSVAITCDGTAIHNMVIAQNEKKTVTAVYAGPGEVQIFQWQILADMQMDSWVTITGQEKESMEVSYALLSSVQDSSGVGYIRCAVAIGEETVYSAPVSVTVFKTPSLSFEPQPVQGERRENGRTNRGQALRALRTDSEYVYITVHFLDAISGRELFNPYVSEIEKGTTFHEIVHAPTYLGFAPYYYPEDLGKSEVNSDITDALNTDNPEHANTTAKLASAIAFGEVLENSSVNTDMSVNVYYWATAVPYAVKYFFQNINDDGYTEQTNLYYTAKAKTGTIIDSTELFEHAGKPTGFTSLYHYPESVAADGSTVFECYYDRNYYLMKFDLNGGYGVEPVYARFDMPIAVNHPTRVGYEFLGWDEIFRNTDGTYTEGDGRPDAVPDRIPDDNKFYQALWKKTDTTYTVIYWLQNADDDNYSFLGYNKYSAEVEKEVTVNIDLTAAIGVVGEAQAAELKYYTYNPDKSEKTVIVKGDGSTVANVYYDRKEYELRFFYSKDQNNRHYVVGGSTWPFGAYKGQNGTADASWTLDRLLGNIETTAWGEVTETPNLKEEVVERYTLGAMTYSGITYYYLSFTARYGQNLNALWPIDIFEPVTVSQSHIANGCQNLDYAYFSAWNGEFKVKYTQEHKDAQTIKGFYQRLDRELLYADAFVDDSTVNYLGFWDNGANIAWSIPRLWVYELYVEDQNGSYQLLKSFDTYDDNDSNKPQSQTQPSLLGYTKKGYQLGEVTKISINSGSGRVYNMDKYVLKFYYTRNLYDLNLFNVSGYWENDRKIPYEMEIGAAIKQDILKMTPPYPDNLEKNAFTFEGWYTTADCVEGSGYLRYNQDTGDWYEGKSYFETMPATDVTLYAHWVPINHEVRFFLTYPDMADYETTGNEERILITTMNGAVNPAVNYVPHGMVIGALDFPTHEENGLTYQFRGWFYMNNGVKTMYTPADVPVIRSMNVFADWGSQVAQPYKIQYLKYGTEIRVADDNIGYAYQGTTRTFLPKAGEPFYQLYPECNQGWYPTLSSHSITIQAEEDKLNLKHNIYTFWYVQAPNIPYVVRCVDKTTGEELGREVHDTNTKAVITERFKVFPERIPDAFYKRLVLSVRIDADGNLVTKPEDNEITFYYTKSTSTAFYAVHYMLQKPGTDGTKPEDYAESEVHTEGTGDINSEISVTPTQQTGYTVSDEAVYISGGGTQGTHVTANKGTFTFKITNVGSELYVYYNLNRYPYTVQYLEYGTDNPVAPEKTVLQTQYGTLVTENAAEVTGWTALAPTSKSLTIRARENVIIFYYVTKSYIAEYKVANDIGGKLDRFFEKVVSDNGAFTFNGATPTAAPGYEFDGWYMDEAGTTPVEGAWIVPDTQTLVPTIYGGNLKAEPETNVFYAKFRALSGDFTITRANAGDEGNGEQIFVYKVTNGDDITLYLTITGNGTATIKDLGFGAYTVEQVNDWSWRYSDETVEIEHTGDETIALFNKASVLKKWLNGNSEGKVNRKEVQKP